MIRTARVNPPLKYWGGKHYLAERIVALMPPHLHYVEPFFGGGAVLLAKDPEGVSEVVNDLHGDLVNFWRVLQGDDTFARFARIASAIPFSEAEYDEATVRLEDSSEADPVRRAVWFFVACRQSRSGSMAGFATLTRNRTRRGMNEQASAWLNAVEGPPSVHARLKRVAILNRPALDAIRQQDGPNTLFYLDPPYLHETRAATGAYRHEMTADGHRELLDAIRNVEGKVMLSGYPSAMYEEALAGWTRHEFDVASHGAGGKTKAREAEVLWCNF